MGLLSSTKYPLVIMDALIDLYGQDIGVGYDVSCTFSKIIAFHGYAHSHLCQVQHHPMYLISFGLEDLKTMEHIFSASNAVSCTIHYATKYHWTQALDLHFQQWDDDNLGLTEHDFECWVDEECQFLMDLKEEPSDCVLSCSYVQALINHENAK
ncbi:hypothetical protein BDR04DRAFT_1126179 [Suillus decipiens]|nr:hypothetical protein BDR04DRAFT_1126179 [Suillus decipiens]